MSWLDGGQRAMMAAIDYGPVHLPDDLFLGPAERVLAGMLVHANTISHARLVALEDTFPRTLAHLGHAAFNQLARTFAEQPAVTAQALAMIGAGFDGFLAAQGHADAADLARFEWLWLTVYHAADAEPLELSGLAGLAPEALLEVMVEAHPAADVARLGPLVRDALKDEVPGIVDAEAILVTRPDVDVLVLPATHRMADLFAVAQNPQSIGNLLGSMREPADDNEDAVAAQMQALVDLINAGAMVRV
jgi:hypothetical protein